MAATHTRLIPYRDTILSGWGRVPRAMTRLLRPEKSADIAAILAADYTAPLIARGAGRSYGDASFHIHASLSTERLNRFRAFDRTEGILTAEAGVTLREIYSLILPHGWMLPVVPGTMDATLGGCLSCNVHGKNHLSHGDFAEHVTSFHLRLADGTLLKLTPETHPDLFWATAGGMGLTGLIEQVTLRLRPITSLSLDIESQRVNSLKEMLACFTSAPESAEYRVGWINSLATGAQLGQGSFEQARHVSLEGGGTPLDRYAPPTQWVVPNIWPRGLLNRTFMQRYNTRRLRRYSTTPQHRMVPVLDFLHPLDGLAQWNRLYGRKGSFMQFQCSIPATRAVAEHLTTLLALPQKYQIFSRLTVLKQHRATRAPLGFAREGYSLAMDFPTSPKLLELLDALATLTCGFGGRVYLAKDAALTQAQFHLMYQSDLPRWQHIQHQADPQGIWRSVMSERLGLHSREEEKL